MSYTTVVLGEVKDYLDSLTTKHRDKANDFIRLLEEHNGVLSEPYSRNLRDKIRELRIDLGRSRHRILYTLQDNQIILLLVAFLKKTPKTPPNIIERAIFISKEYKRIKD